MHVGQIILVVVVSITAVLALLGCGILLGYNYRDLKDRWQEHEAEVEDRKAEKEDNSSAIIDISPKELEQRQHTTTPEDEEESQIITVKSPRQLAADKADRERKELDKLTNGAIR